MHYETEDAIARAKSADVFPVRCTKLDAHGYYHLRGANGETRVIASGSAQTAWANAKWPKRGKWAVAWMYGRAAN